MLELEPERLKSFNPRSPALFFFLFHFIFYFLLPPLPVFGRLWWAFILSWPLPVFILSDTFASSFFMLLLCKAAGQYQGVSYPFPDNFPNLSSPRVPPSLAPSWCPLIFMRLTGQPCSASLSLSVGEEAARCQQLMDFWKTQTVMHRRVENCGESGRKGRIWSDA